MHSVPILLRLMKEGHIAVTGKPDPKGFWPDYPEGDERNNTGSELAASNTGGGPDTGANNEGSEDVGPDLAATDSRRGLDRGSTGRP